MNRLNKNLVLNIIHSVLSKNGIFVFVFISWLLFPFKLWSIVPVDITFVSYKIEDGLSQSSVNAIAQDADGFMWFGTRDGLNRFDSRRFKPFFPIFINKRL